MTFLKTKSHRLDFLTRVCSLKLREFTAKFGLDPRFMPQARHEQRQLLQMAQPIRRHGRIAHEAT
jgi:hypothetical protein